MNNTESDDGDQPIVSVEDFRNRRERNSLSEVDARYAECGHFKVELDHQSRSVTCLSCKKQLDPFWYLSLLSREWKHRAYRDERYKEAYEKLQQQEKNARARGKYWERPTSGRASEVWDEFCKYKVPNGIYRSGNEWYGLYGDSTYGLSYVRMLIAAAARAAEHEGEPWTP